MDEHSFGLLFATVFKYLKFLDIIQEEYNPEIGAAKFKQYDYNKNGTIGFDEFESMLQNDFHCRQWMQALGFAKEEKEAVKDRVVNQEIAREEEGGFGMEVEEGDQFLAVNAWTKVAEHMAPIDKADYP